MKQRCKKCGNWVEATEKGIFDRAIAPVEDAVKTKDGIFEMAGDFLGLGKVGRVLDKVVKTPTAIVKGIGEAALGSRYEFVCLNCFNVWEVDDNTMDETNIYEQEQKEIKLVENFIAKERSMYQKTDEEKKLFINEISSSFPSVGKSETRARLFNVLAFSQFELLGDVNKAMDALAESLKLIDDPNTHALRGVVMGNGRTSIDKYKVLQELIRYDEKVPSDFFTSSEIRQHIELQEQEYVENFMSIPYNQRKFLVFDSELRVLPNSFKVLSINNCPTDLQFTEGHPIEKQIYICHPHNNKFYLPIDDYQLQLFYDEIKELCVLLQGLGAKRIEIKDSRESEEQSQQKRSIEAKAGGEYNGYGANIGGSQGYENEEYLKVRKELCRIQEFSMGETMPCVPEGLVWYNHRVDWQRIANQRLNGSIYQHDYLSSSRSSMVTDMEKKTLEADFNMLIAKGNASADIHKEKLFKESVNASWELDVEFYPLEVYKQRQEKKKRELLQLKEEEEKKKSSFNGKGNILLGCIILLLLIIIILLCL